MSVPTTTRVWKLKEHPKAFINENTFALTTQSLPALQAGEVLLQGVCYSVDPAQRAWITGKDTYVAGVQVGDVMRGGGIAKVVATKNDKFKVGDLVRSQQGWVEYCVVNPAETQIYKLRGETAEQAISVTGITGLTAYFGMLDIGKPEQGDVVVVSGAAGATGSIAGQIAKLKGCTVIGIAGGKDKCQWLTGTLGFDHAIDYKSENVYRRLRDICPGSVNVYFDNVGGDILDDVLAHIAVKARIVMCGAISQYNTANPKGPARIGNVIVKRARMEGFIVTDYYAQFSSASKQLGEWVREGKVKFTVESDQGFENLPKTLNRLFAGPSHLGKLVCKL
eukprot:GFYU01011060.1.p1 GENE.GFYU01011060.1~~GFYU01011060.1.p1  ORF type:complete len:336 (-),score=99.98 GFYU01011060.1:819-1826(-)